MSRDSYRKHIVDWLYLTGMSTVLVFLVVPAAFIIWLIEGNKKV